jgi:glycosyltransferase involved in cell wall biosynthesis
MRRKVFMSEQPTAPRVCLIADRVVLAEALDWARALAGGLARGGAEVDLVVPEAFMGGFPSPEGGVRLFKWPSAMPVVRGRDLAELAERATEGGRPVLHALSHFSCGLGIRLAEAMDVPLVVTCHRPSGDLGRGVERHLHRHVAGVLAPGARVLEAVRRRYRLDERRALLVRPGVSSARTVACFSRPSNTPVVVLAARPRNHEAVKAAMTAASQLLTAGEAFHLLLLAGPADRHMLRARTNELGLRGIVTVYDASLPLSHVLGSGDLFVQPYPQRQPSADLLTAMGCGLAPLVLDDTPYDHLRDGENALLLTGVDAGQIAGRLREALADRRATRRLAHNARETVLALHSHPRELRGTLAAYESLLGAERLLKLPGAAEG